MVGKSTLHHGNHRTTRTTGLGPMGSLVESHLAGDLEHKLTPSYQDRAVLQDKNRVTIDYGTNKEVEQQSGRGITIGTRRKRVLGKRSPLHQTRCVQRTRLRKRCDQGEQKCSMSFFSSFDFVVVVERLSLRLKHLILLTLVVQYKSEHVSVSKCCHLVCQLAQQSMTVVIIVRKHCGKQTLLSVPLAQSYA